MRYNRKSTYFTAIKLNCESDVDEYLLITIRTTFVVNLLFSSTECIKSAKKKLAFPPCFTW